ncbi:MAG TPA: immune inhibitor A domain-containing protein [Chthoniobacterales bacterium]|jgi:M6 family metalloprotease-like protein|nr:immune inhibitor A domain-containing protein [Chthoniobacterales bacterium]
MRPTPSLTNGFLIPRIATALSLFGAAAFLTFYSVAGPLAPNAATAGQPPFTPVENRVTNGGLTVLAKVFSPNGKVNPGETFPVVLIYQADATGAANVTITVTLHSASLFQQSIPAPASGNGTAGSPLVYTIPAVAPNGAGQIVLEARAKNLTEDPEVMWKDVSANVTLAVGLNGPLPARTHGPKVTTLESAVYGDRPFPVVMVQYQDVRRCVGPGDPFPECSGDHTAAALDTSINSRTTGKSVWQLYQDESFGQLFPDGRVSPAPNSPDTPFAATAAYPYKWSTIDPQGVCTGTTLAPPTGSGAPLYVNRVEGGWYLLPGTQGYYGADKTGHGAVGLQAQQGLLAGIDDACGPTGKIAYDAAAIADPDIDYNDFDTDKDGLVDFFNLVFAGDGGNLSTTPSGLNNVWPHSSDLRQYFKDENGQTGYVSNDQFRNRLNQLVYWTDATRKVQTTTPTSFPVFVRVASYNVNPESAVESVSVIAHEYGHSLGMPDYYSTGTRGTFGSWDLNGTDYFQYHSVFSRQDLGWVVPKPVTSGQLTLTESKYDTGQIHWQRPDGTPYTLTGPGIHNAEVYRLGLPPRILIDKTPSGVHAWYSQAGNDFGCAVDGGGHNLDVFLPDMAQTDSASSVTLTIKHLYEIEWDYDYAFVLVSDDDGATWTSLPSQTGTTTPNAVNPHQNQCQMTYNNGITGVSDGDATNDVQKRADEDYSGAVFVTDSFDLTAYKGKTIILRFSYSTDPGLAKRGWFIDDVEIKADNNVVYSSDFESGKESARLFPSGWVWVSSAEGSPADHAFYIELRDRISNDFDGKGQSERGTPTWEGGVSMIYTDEAHGYGNFGVDDPPAVSPVDSNPQPGNESPNLDDAAFTLARPTFDGCTHIENYDAEPGPGTSIPWILPNNLKFTVTAMNGMSPGPNLPATPATATLVAEVNPNCNVEILPPELSLGNDYQNPDPDGTYTLNWTRPATATGPDLLQVATTCGAAFTEDAESGQGNWEVTTEGTYAGLTWQVAPSNEKPNHSSATFRARATDGVTNASAIMTYKNPLVIPEGGTTTLAWDDWSMNEGEDAVYVEVSDGGGTWTTIFSQARSELAPDAAAAFATDPLFHKEVDLAAYRGKTILLRFRYFLGPENRPGSTPLGWYVDNIALNTANWADLTTTSATSFVDHKPSGNYCYRVRSTFSVGGASLPSAFSNIVTTQVASGVLPPPRLQNISARARVLANDNVLIGGFITRDAPKRVIIRAIGPSLQAGGGAVPGRMTDPTLELYRQGQSVPIAVNDDWQSNKTEVEQTNLAPTDPKESAIVMTLDPGAYTAVLKGKNGETGIAVAEVYDLDSPSAPAVLRNLSARAFVDTQDNVLIGGFIAGPTNTSTTAVVVRAIGPSVKSQLPEALEDTTLEVVNANGSPITNDDWEQSPDAPAILAAGLAPSDPKESAVMLSSLPAGAHTAIVRGKGNPRGVGLVEIYNLQ